METGWIGRDGLLSYRPEGEADAVRTCIRQEALQHVLDDLGDGIILTDRKETVVYMNTAAKRILAMEEDGLGKAFSELCPLVDLKTGRAFQSPLEDVLKEGKARGLARNIGLFIGREPHYLSATCSPILGDTEEHEPVGCSIVLRDVTTLRHFEIKHEIDAMQLRIAKSAAEQAAETKSRFLANMSHVVRTPINGIQGMLELAMQEPMTESRQHCLQLAHERAGDLLQIVDDILDFSRLEAGSLVVTAIRFDVRALLARLESAYAHEAQKKGLTFEVAESTELPRYAVGDPQRIRQIFRALIQNALKFTSKGGITVGAFLGLHDGRRTLYFFVRDTGIGMNSEAKKFLFRPFRQGGSSATRRYGGMGVGLILVHDILALMKGGISVHTAMGLGSKFSFWIPYEEAQTADEEFRDKGVYINPERGQKRKRRPKDASVEMLLAYCNAKYEKFHKHEKGHKKEGRGRKGADA